MAAIKGYKCIITLSEKMSLEKEQILHALGAQVVRTPAGVPIDSPDSIISVARRLQKEIPHSYILDQYTNPENPAAHEFGTAEELWYQTDGKVDVVISGAGTGGTVTGTSRGLKKHSPDTLVVGVDPVGSVLAQPDSLNQLRQEYKVEGIGYDFVPQVLDQTEPDIWIKTSDPDSFHFAR
jgi:cystathionine beta-synthase